MSYFHLQFQTFYLTQRYLYLSIFDLGTRSLEWRKSNVRNHNPYHYEWDDKLLSDGNEQQWNLCEWSKSQIFISKIAQVKSNSQNSIIFEVLTKVFFNLWITKTTLHHVTLFFSNVCIRPCKVLKVISQLLGVVEVCCNEADGAYIRRESDEPVLLQYPEPDSPGYNGKSSNTYSLSTKWSKNN